jgi:hypothetical protein
MKKLFLFLSILVFGCVAATKTITQTTAKTSEAPPQYNILI